MHDVKVSRQNLNRKMLSQLVILDPTSFKTLCEKVKAS
jgi:ribosomal protein L20